MGRAPKQYIIIKLLAMSFLPKGHKRPEMIVEGKSGKAMEMV